MTTWRCLGDQRLEQADPCRGATEFQRLSCVPRSPDWPDSTLDKRVLLPLDSNGLAALTRQIRRRPSFTASTLFMFSVRRLFSFVFSSPFPTLFDFHTPNRARKYKNSRFLADGKTLSCRLSFSSDVCTLVDSTCPHRPSCVVLVARQDTSFPVVRHDLDLAACSYFSGMQTWVSEFVTAFLWSLLTMSLGVVRGRSRTPWLSGLRHQTV